MRGTLVVPFVALLCACGGGDKPADHPSGGGTSGANGSIDGAGGGDAGPATTTTVLVGDAGELQGSKLTTSGTITVDGGGASSPTLDPSHHDPGRTRDDIMTIIKSHRDEARACYDTALKAHPGIEGNIYITWKLDPKGAVVATGVDDSMSQIHDAALVKCIGDVIRKITWAASPRGVETTERYPFNFHPRGTQH